MDGVCIKRAFVDVWLAINKRFTAMCPAHIPATQGINALVFDLLWQLLLAYDSDKVSAGRRRDMPSAGIYHTRDGTRHVQCSTFLVSHIFELC